MIINVNWDRANILLKPLAAVKAKGDRAVKGAVKVRLELIYCDKQILYTGSNLFFKE